MRLSSSLLGIKKAIFQAPEALSRISWPLIAYEKSAIKSSNDYYRQLGKKSPTYCLPRLPEQTTDIKGVDPEVYKHVNRRQMYKQLPTLASNAFFTLKFIPASHHISLARKSTIAYMFTNKGGPLFNDDAYTKLFNNYNGKYRKDTYFGERKFPMDTAINRQRFRKLIKQTLFNAITTITKPEDISKVSGVFMFRFGKVPFTDNDKAEVKNYMTTAVTSLFRNELQKRLENISREHESQASQLFPKLTVNNTFGHKNVPGYVPKYPFLKKIGRGSA